MKHKILKEYFGYDSFRPGQEAVVEALLANRDVLAIMPTGAGKSLCYQVPGLIFEGITLVISPLIALMKDQVNALTQAGVEAAFINSSLSTTEFRTIMQKARNDDYKIMYVAPERLNAEGFIEFAQSANISMIAIDEAHCVSQWGHDFRPSYRRIINFVESLPKRPVIGAFTATATEAVKENIVELLELQTPFIQKTGFDRKNLYFEVQKPKNKQRALLNFMNQHSKESGIIYCSTRNTVEEVCELLQQKGYKATRYHAGLSDSERKQNQDDFVFDRKPIMVSTNAFGMGIDKSNVSYVVHFNMPKNIESYYQEAGRAGRDGEPATCLLLYSGQDVKTNEFLISKGESSASKVSFEERTILRNKDLDLLKKMTWYCTTSDCLRGYILKYFGEKAPIHCGKCSNCDTKFEQIDVTIEAQKIISCIMRLDQRQKSFGKSMVAKILHGSEEQKITQFGLNTLSTYGIMEDTSIRRIIHIIEFLLEKGWISQTTSEYPTLRVNEQSLEIIRGNKFILMDLPKEVKISKLPRTYKPSDQEILGEETREAQADLFVRLVTLRKKLAEAENMPAYIIFPDAALRDMCRKLPTTEGEFLEVSGVGQAKLEKYGDVFLTEIAEFKNETL